MVYKKQYISPIGTITVACDENTIIGLWFDGQRHFENTLIDEPEIIDEIEIKKHSLLLDAVTWLDIYFSGQKPDFLPPLRYDTTAFRKRVCDIMLTIPYGKTITYGEIAADIARERGTCKMSAQAVGGAVGHNPIALMIPCHRVIGAGGNLTGYGGGMDRKVKLLELEKVDMTGLYVPKNGRNFEIK